ncbi:DUF11 domain-containing protein [Pseudoxanthomonas sp. SE1]|uniref:DUF11 domain-containing protein n=1 Tax=Pseudoxanthomonas sp. SE1 TaxID=1664560 RepID=UPI00240CF488|nr:DUF11 domain-containing protein [Pseudoxanthomonas sp. SE1]WFC43311.1 DUF11 domain-containing protein [Pseudoxanthomonas sp. SE1]
MALPLLGFSQQAQAQLSCDTGYAYMLMLNNTTTPATTALRRLNLSNGTWTNVVASTPYTGLSNALGLTVDGSAAWMIEAYASGGSSVLQVRGYDAVSGAWSNFNVSIPGQANAGGLTEIPRGAVSPVNGVYYISRPNASNASEQLVYAFDTSANTFIGQVARVASVTNTGNGDLTFDAYGNMYLVASGANGSYIYRIDQGSIPTSSSTALVPSTSIGTIPSSAGLLPGLAFDGDGWLYATTTTQIFKINPTTGAIAAGYPVAVSGAGGAAYVLDLADCNTAPTLRLSKDATRLVSTDQFQLQITPGTAPGNTATTTGSTNGVQTARVGHLPVIAGETYTLTETQQGTAVLNNYDVSLTCRDVANSNVVVPATAVTTTGTSRAYGVVIPGVTLGGNTPQVECTYLNTPPPQPDFGTCDARMFLDQTNSGATLSTLYNVGYASTPFTYASLGSGAPRNGIGYNMLDNYIYAMEWGGFSGNELVRVGSDGSTVNLGVVTGLPASNYNNGVISPTGDYYVMPGFGGTTLYRVNLTTRVATVVTLSSSISVSDFAWHNGLLWGINSNEGTLVSIDPASGAVTTIGSSFPVNNAIAMWGFDNGLFASGGSTIYAIDPATGAATLMSTAPGATNADGANCPGATIQFNADLSVTKTNTPGSGPNDLSTDTYSPGETRTYTVVVTNLSGSFGAQNVTVSDPIPAGIDAATVSWTCANTSGGSRCGAASGTGALNDTGLDLPPNAVATYRVTMTVPTGFTGDLTNTVTITPPSTINDTNAANNTATDVDQSAPQLTIRKISIGGVDSFGFTGTNGVVAQTLTTTTAGSPVSGVTQVLTAAGTATTITESTTPAAYQLTGITCTGLGAGGTATPDLVNRTVALDVAATAAGANIVCTFTNTLQQTDIQVVKTASPDPVVSGEVVTYQIVVSNNGPLAASNVLLTDVAGVGQDCTTPSTTATCSAAGGASCPSPTVPVSSLLGAGITIPVLPVGGLVTISLQCSVSADGL